jgi:hypothetical protein
MVNDNDKIKKEMIKAAKEMMKLMILKLNDDLYGQGSKLRTRALQYLELVIEKLKIDLKNQKMFEEISQWEYENNMLQNDGQEQYDWEFQGEWL